MKFGFFDGCSQGILLGYFGVENQKAWNLPPLFLERFFGPNPDNHRGLIG